MKKNCGTCGYAEFSLTPAGRIVQTHSGHCRVVLAEIKIVLPACVPAPTLSKHGIWPEEGTTCEFWKEKTQ